jgi:hypothetical protein
MVSAAWQAFQKVTRKCQSETSSSISLVKGLKMPGRARTLYQGRSDTHGADNQSNGLPNPSPATHRTIPPPTLGG